MKYPIIFSLLSLPLLAIENYTIKPIGELQFRYDDRHKEYTALGQSVLNEKEVSYDDYTFGGIFGVQSSWENFSINTLAYGVARLHKKDPNTLKNEKTYYDNSVDRFIYLGEFNIKKEYKNHSFTLGRQTYSTSLVNRNYRITQNSYEGLNYNYSKNNFDFKSLYFNKISSSTMSNNVPLNHKYGFLGYGLGYDIGGFQSLSKHIINKDLSTNGAVHFLAKYGENERYISYENLFVDNFFNTSNLTLAYNIKDIYLKTGIISQVSVGEDFVEKHIESTQSGKKLEAKHYQLELKYKKNNFQVAYAIAKSPSKKNAIYTGTLLHPFSNQPSWLIGLNTAHATISDTVSQKISATSFTKLYQIPVVISSAYIKYEIGENNGMTNDKLDTSEWYFHLQGQFTKNISALIQYSYVKNFDVLTNRSSNVKVSLKYRF